MVIGELIALLQCRSLSGEMEQAEVQMWKISLVKSYNGPFYQFDPDIVILSTQLKLDGVGPVDNRPPTD